MTDRNNTAETGKIETGQIAIGQIQTERPPPFFVGYLPMPAPLKKFYWPLVVSLLIVCGLLGYWVAAQQKTSGAATWHTAQTTTMQGILTLHPYPALHRLNPQNPGEVESVLLVRQGKHSANQFAARFDRQRVVIDGHKINRGGWSMLEIAAEESIQKENSAPLDEATARLQALSAIRPLGKISLKGEIVDSKCFLGVMKPGAGTIHKACAEVCLLGGIPPMLVAKDAQNQKFGYLIAHPNGSDASAALAKYAAEPVQITGQLQQQGSLLFIQMNDDGLVMTNK